MAKNKEVRTMVKMVTWFVALAVLLACGISSGVEQTQGTQIQVGDQTWLEQGFQTADVLQNLVVLTDQQLDATAGQSLLANVSGTSHATSEGAEVGVIRNFEATTWQGQIVAGPTHPKREDQTLDLASMLSVGMNEGPGEGNALQLSTLLQEQGEGNFAGVNTASVSGLVLQVAQMAGFANTLNGVETMLQLSTVQNQVTQ